MVKKGMKNGGAPKKPKPKKMELIRKLGDPKNKGISQENLQKFSKLAMEKMSKTGAMSDKGLDLVEGKAGGGYMGKKMVKKTMAKGGAMKTKGGSKGGKMRVRPPSSKKSGLYGR